MIEQTITFEAVEQAVDADHQQQDQQRIREELFPLSPEQIPYECKDRQDQAQGGEVDLGLDEVSKESPHRRIGEQVHHGHGGLLGGLPRLAHHIRDGNALLSQPVGQAQQYQRQHHEEPEGVRELVADNLNRVNKLLKETALL